MRLFRRKKQSDKAKADTTRHATLGYHIPGEYHYFTHFSEDVRFLGNEPNRLYSSYMSFSALVTAVHEHHHFLQELLQGFSWWRTIVHDDLPVYISKLTGRIGKGSPISFPLWKKSPDSPRKLTIDSSEPLSIAQKLAYELDTIDRWAVSSDVTRRHLSLEVLKYPEFAKLLNEDVNSLSTIDLLECHAALLTELYISKLVVERPSQFDMSVVQELEPLYRLSKLPENYGRPLKVMVRILNYFGLSQLFKFTTPTHPMYSNIEYGPLYLLTAFLLDYALHLPPYSVEMFSERPEVTTIFDLHPPLRFISLAMAIAVEIATNKHGFRHLLVSERRYYSEGASILAQLVNEIRTAERRTVARYAKLDEVPKTFLSMDETTELWHAAWKNSVIRGRFKEIDALRLRCLEFRRSHPDSWFKLDLLGTTTHLEVPHTFISSEGLGFLPFVSDPLKKGHPYSKSEEAELKQYLQSAVEKYATAGFAHEWEIEGGEDLPITIFPFRFILECMEYEMFFLFGQMLSHQGEMRCPLTTSIGRFVPCGPRTPSCESITDPRNLPPSGCRLRGIIETHFCEVEKLLPKEQ